MKALIVGEDDSDSENMEVWSTGLEEDEVRKPSHGACVVVKTSDEVIVWNYSMVQSISSSSK